MQQNNINREVHHLWNVNWLSILIVCVDQTVWGGSSGAQWFHRPITYTPGCTHYIPRQEHAAPALFVLLHKYKLQPPLMSARAISFLYKRKPHCPSRATLSLRPVINITLYTLDTNPYSCLYLIFKYPPEISLFRYFVSKQ